MVEKEVQNIRALLQIKSILWDGVSLWKIPFHVLGSAKRRHLRIKRGEDSSLSQKIKVIEKNLTRFDLYVADEMFLTGTAAEVIGVVEMDGRVIGNGVPGPLTLKLRQLFFKYARS